MDSVKLSQLLASARRSCFHRTFGQSEGIRCLANTESLNTPQSNNLPQARRQMARQSTEPQLELSAANLLLRIGSPIGQRL